MRFLNMAVASLFMGLAMPSLCNAALVVSYRVTGATRDGAYIRALQRTQILERIVAEFDRVVVPDNQPIGLVLRECGTANAYYVPHERRIFLCSEIVRQIAQRSRLSAASSAPNARARRASALSGATLAFLVGHEYGHALIHTRRLPVIAGEENAADAIAAALTLNRPKFAAEATLGAILFFDRTPTADRETAGDVHALDIQRQINVACWAIGSSVQLRHSFSSLVPAQRAERCAHEWQQMQLSMRKLLGASYRPKVKVF